MFLKTRDFIGPLDLLLELIEKKDLEITRVSLSEVADQYLTFIQFQKTTLKESGEFLEIAAKLALIKSITLLPVPSPEIEEEVEEFKERLIVYKEFRIITKELEKKCRRKICFERKGSNFLKDQKIKELNIRKKDLEITYQNLLNKLPNLDILRKESIRASIGINKIIKSIEKKLSKINKASFFEFSGKRAKFEKMLIFLAFLEIGKRGEARLIQNKYLGDILLSKLKTNG